MKKFSLSGFGRRQITLLSLVILIAVAGYINITHKDEDIIPASGDVDIVFQDAPEPKDDYFTASRLDRDKSRSAAMEVYREVLENKESSSETKELAQKDLTASAKAMETEAVLEGLIKAKGFDEVIVYISNESANIVVRTIGLTPAQAAQIKDLVKENAYITAEKIKIVEIK